MQVKAKYHLFGDDMIRVGNVWYPETEEWIETIIYSQRAKHDAFISERNKRARIYKFKGRPPLVKLKLPKKTKP